MQTEYKRAFTLVELLVVIAIIGLMLALIMPAFRGLGRSAGMGSAVAQVRSSLSLARQWAITKREPVTIGFVDAENVKTFPDQKYRTARSYAIWYGAPAVYLKEWTTLPPGIVFATNGTHFSAASNSDNVFLVNTLAAVPFPTATSATIQNFHYIRFRTDGRLANGANRNLYLMDAVLDENGQILTASAGGPRYQIEVQHLTGQIRVLDRAQ